MFDRVCAANGIQHKLTKPYHPWTNGQAERMNRTIKDATTKVFHYPDLKSLKPHVLAFVAAYNFAKHLKALKWKTPFEAVLQAWTKGLVKLQNRPRSPHPGTKHLARALSSDHAPIRRRIRKPNVDEAGRLHHRLNLRARESLFERSAESVARVRTHHEETSASIVRQRHVRNVAAQ